MTHKEQFKAEVEKVKLIIQSNRAQGAFAEGYLIGQESVLGHFENFVNSMQEEPKFKTGDRIKPIDSCLGSPRIIEDVCDGWYVTNIGTLDFEFEDNWELVEEPVSEDLEEAATNYATHLDENWSTVKDGYIAENEKAAFKDGACWQMQKIMKDGVDAEIMDWAHIFTSIKVLEPEKAEAMIKEKFNIGDKVKLIIIKTDYEKSVYQTKHESV